jgi:hypothetical protein
MTYDEVVEVLRNKNANWTGDNAYQGLQIIAKYFDPSVKDIITHANHDEIFSVGIQDALEAGMTDEDVQELARLNWSEDQERFHCFV